MSRKLLIKNRSGQDIAFTLLTPDGRSAQYTALSEDRSSHKNTRLEIDLNVAKSSVFQLHNNQEAKIDVILDNKEVRKSFLGLRKKERDVKYRLYAPLTFKVKDNTDYIILDKAKH